jgi:hypothetical protein
MRHHQRLGDSPQSPSYSSKATTAMWQPLRLAWRGLLNAPEWPLQALSGSRPNVSYDGNTGRSKASRFPF